MELLLVEDDPDARILTEQFAAALGYGTRVFAHPEDALRSFSEKPCRVVLVDWGLPAMDGLAFCRRLRELPRGADAYIVMLTARQELNDVRLAIESGVDDYLIKPFDLPAFTVRLLLADRNLNPAGLAGADDSQHFLRERDRRMERIQMLLQTEITRRTETETQLKESERIYRMLARSIPGSVFLFDTELRLRVAEPKGEDVGTDVLEGKNVAEAFPDIAAILLPHYRAVLKGRAADFELERNGRFFRIQTVPVRNDEGRVYAGLHLGQDITQARLDLQRLQDSEERYELAAQGTNDGIWDWDLRTDRVFYSFRWKAIAGVEGTPGTESPAFWLDRIHPDDKERFTAEMNVHLTDVTRHFLSEHRLLLPGQEVIWVLARGMALRDAEGKAYRIAGSITDITGQKRLEENLYRNALYDNETRLPNGALFLDRLKSAFDRTSRNPDYLFAVVSLELDRFEIMTESLKRNKVEELLRTIVERLSDRLRSSDTFARMGESKFAILLDDVVSHDEAKRLFNEIQDEISLPFQIGGTDLFVGANMGIAMSDSDYEEAEQMLRDADVARHHARETGSTGYEIYREFMQSHMRIRMNLETQLRIALQNMDFELYYQPIVSLSQRRVVGLEALLRWEHPELGMISPAQFVPLAEETGMIRPIGEWALRTACLQLKAWSGPDTESLYMAVNLSARQFQEEDLIELTKSCISQANVRPELLVLEITESAAMKDHESAMNVLFELRNLGFRVAIDDFGTGYSSLAYLKTMPADILKVDRSFIHDVHQNADSAAIAAAIIQLGRGLKLKVVAEGVETKEQLDFVRDNGCDLVQGFYFSKPMPAGEVAAFLTADRLISRLID